VAGFTGLWSRSSGWRNQAHTSYSSWLRVVALSPDADGTTDQDDFSLLRNATNNKAPVRSNEIGNGRIDFNQLSEMKESIDIISVIESYDLDRFERKSDDRATALCPFHDDENPSLSIDRTRKMYKCFSCGAGGDAFRFVREYSKLKGQQMSFYEAVLEVSTKFGDGHVEGIGKSVQAESPELRQRKERTLYANAVAAAFYATCLTKPSAGGARQYLRQRGLTPEAVRTFALGFAPDFYYGANRSRKKWGEDSLVQHMQSLNFTVDELLEAGLATETKTTEEPVQKFSFGEGELLFSTVNVYFYLLLTLQRSITRRRFYFKTNKYKLPFRFNHRSVSFSNCCSDNGQGGSERFGIWRAHLAFDRRNAQRLQSSEVLEQSGVTCF
jgi:hypothetical protein